MLVMVGDIRLRMEVIEGLLVVALRRPAGLPAPRACGA